jgi:penicillin-binding protein 2
MRESVSPDSSRLRLGVLGIVVLSLFAALLVRLWYLQVMASDQYQAVSTNSVRLVTTEAPRGRILDRNGVELVRNRISDVVTVDRNALPMREDVKERVAFMLRISVPELDRRLASKRYSAYKPVPIARDVPKETLIFVREHASEFPGVANTRLTEREYTQGTLAAHLLGYTAEINDSELAARKRLRRGYKPGDSIGKTGVELTFENDLRGQPGIEELEVDAAGRVLRTLNSRPPVPGHDVRLTIDLNVQRMVEESLAQGLAAAREASDREFKKHFLAPAGAAVVLDPRDGSVLAMASNPTYDPSIYVDGSVAEFRRLQDPALHAPLNDRASEGLYAPGSTFKLITAMAAMRKGLISANTTIDDKGSIKIGNQIFRNAGTTPHGRVSLTRAITVSSDVYFYSIGDRFWQARSRYGASAIQDMARDLGLGEGIGRISDPDIRKRLHESNAKAFPNGGWFAGDNANLAIGQGELAITPLQLANAYATFANGGTLWAPRLGAEVIDASGIKVRDVAPRAVRRLDLTPALRNPILSGLKGVVKDSNGTAHSAFTGFPLDRFPLAGKTGTAQVANKQDTAIFSVFGPADAPQFEVTVLLEEAGFGADAAAPVARRILDGLIGQPLEPITRAGGID